ncbi:OLC1v1011524C1 [Oldenlandia corymbosa var. corymbosa]|uniref:Protein unc-45 homolog B n=1 Tax=Oldenlandia corymbosa var. corymbosa TaxID=529605 RepID=A0AAV1DW77_OLDCO|nr:OLC1v1011524C1 [Oldenlandia corymbosa var. corymbosa]
MLLYRGQKTCQFSPIRSFRRHKNQLTKHQKELSCTNSGCLFCIMNEPDPSLRRSGLSRCFSRLHQHQVEDDDDDLVITLTGLWKIALANPDDPEFPSLGIFDCMAKLIHKCIKGRKWFARGNNVCIPYYAAHIIGSYTINKERLAEIAVKSNVIPPLMELMKGKFTWVEQRVAVRALGHIASHKSTFKSIAVHEEEIIHLAVKISSTCFDTVCREFLRLKVEERVGYHRDLMSRGQQYGGLEMENQKAEEWASQLQCWSLYLLNCFTVLRISSIDLICKKDFLEELCDMWGGFQSISLFSGVCLIRSICLTKDGRRRIASSRVVIEGLCNLSRSSDEWQRKAVESILLLLQDQETRAEVIDLVLPYMVDLVELKIVKGDRVANVGETITRLLLQDYGRIKFGQMALKKQKSQSALEEIWNLKVERIKRDDMISEEEFRERKIKVGLLKHQGNQKFWAGDAEEAAEKYTEALDLCPLKMKKERIVLYSNRAQCYLLLTEAGLAISDATRAVCLSGSVRPHLKSLWRRSQAYDMLGMARHSLMDCLMFINHKTQFKTKRNIKVPYYAVRMLDKQINATKAVCATSKSEQVGTKR